MKTKALLPLVAAAWVAVLTGWAETTAPAPAAAKPLLPVIVVDSVSPNGSAFTDFDRLDIALRRVAEQRAWPVKIEAERLAANQPEHPTELRITLQRVRADPGEYVFRAWTILVQDGAKHDFGVVTYRHFPLLGQNSEALYEEIFKGGAAAIAKKVEPVLFPELQPKK